MKPTWTSRRPNCSLGVDNRQTVGFLIANGFSQNTGLPRLIAAITYAGVRRAP